ncbi:MAG: bifunctional salicylyl-CoA 5-hydroxylase/oxidoreductase [Pseudomonadota bacterium]
MRIACLGGGPAGLYFAISMKRHDPSHEIVVIERNQPDDTFGWGVVLSDETLDNLAANDAPSAERIREHFAYWDDIAVIHEGVKTVSTGHGFCGIGRHRLLLLLQERARELGVELRFGCELDEQQIESLRHEYDMVLAADGLNSRTRMRHAEHFRPDIDVRACKFVWLGTHQTFNDAFTFIFEKTEHGWVWAHAYQFNDDTATFIVECSEATWQAFGFGEMNQQESIAVCERIFARHLGGHSLMSNAHHIRGSAWINFPRVLCERWSFDNVVLMGDAAATAHFSIGSGTKLALESAIALADYLHSAPDMPAAFDRYEQERRTEVLRLQSAARNSTEWFEQVERYLDLDPVQFNYSLLTRSQRISHENLRLRDPEWLASAEGWFQARAGNPGSTRPPMFAPFRLRDMTLDNRVVVSPMAQYKAVDGCPTDWHFTHYAERAKGGAGLVYTEMSCVTPEGRITPGCPGFYTEAHETAWKRLCDFVHAETPAKLCAQIGHSGPKGSTQLGWEEMDAPLPEGNWPILAASAVPWSERNQVPRAMDRADMDVVRDAFVDAARMADRAGFDMLEVHAAHGYLLSSFITPLTNRRDDEYGGSLDNRLRYPLEVICAVREAWPADKPLSVRISANDWVGEEGITPDDAVEVARRLKAAEVDIVDVSAGQTSTRARPVYGRMFQTPFSDRIRNETGMATMAVGNIYQADHVNSILMAGRADLACLARPHLADPYWTLHVAAALGDREAAWPAPYRAGADQLQRLAERGEGWV